MELTEDGLQHSHGRKGPPAAECLELTGQCCGLGPALQERRYMWRCCPGGAHRLAREVLSSSGEECSFLSQEWHAVKGPQPLVLHRNRAGSVCDWSVEGAEGERGGGGRSVAARRRVTGGGGGGAACGQAEQLGPAHASTV